MYGKAELDRSQLEIKEAMMATFTQYATDDDTLCNEAKTFLASLNAPEEPAIKEEPQLIREDTAETNAKIEENLKKDLAAFLSNSL